VKKEPEKSGEQKPANPPAAEKKTETKPQPK
jgi:hypothetical protein